MSNSGVSGGGTAGVEVGYDQITSAVTISSTTEATPTTVIACAAHVFNGAPVIAEFFASSVYVQSAGGFCDVVVTLFEGATEIGRIAVFGDSTFGFSSLIGKLRFTPTAGSHTYTVGALIGTGTATSASIGAGAGGTGAQTPAYMRFTYV